MELEEVAEDGRNRCSVLRSWLFRSRELGAEALVKSHYNFPDGDSLSPSLSIQCHLICEYFGCVLKCMH